MPSTLLTWGPHKQEVELHAVQRVLAQALGCLDHSLPLTKLAQHLQWRYNRGSRDGAVAVSESSDKCSISRGHQ
jgi:hypothetical protein